MPAKPVKLIGRKKRKTFKATIKSRRHAPGSPATAGHEERLPMFIKRTLELKRNGYRLYQIAKIISEEYDLESIPCITTIARWRDEGQSAVTEDILKLQSQTRIADFILTEELLDKWIPIALAQKLDIQRWRMVEGTLQPVIDENALEEQLDATKAIVTILARRAKLLGIDMEKVVATNGDGPESLQALQVIMINHMAKISNQPQEKVINGEVLELASGLEDEVVDAV